MGYYDALRALSQYEGGYYYLIPKNYRSVPWPGLLIKGISVHWYRTEQPVPF